MLPARSHRLLAAARGIRDLRLLAKLCVEIQLKILIRFGYKL